MPIITMNTPVYVTKTEFDEKLFKIDRKFDDLTAIMLKEFDRMYSKFDLIDKRFDTLESRLDDRFAGIDARFNDIDVRLDSIDHILLLINNKLTK